MQFARNCKVHLAEKNSMARIHSQNYSYANNLSGELINVSNAQRSEQYFCPICGEKMTPHMGKIRRWHFTHKSGAKCNYETYLHKIAKIRIKNSFDEANVFQINFSPKIICSVADCPLNVQKPCTWRDLKSFDIKKFYDTCSIEKSVGQFVGDLVLSNSKRPDIPPILIEIFVSHKSTDEKLNSEYRIIEIKVDSEKSIEEIVSKHSITELVYYKNEWSDGIDIVKFVNFHGESYEIPTEKHQRSKFQFWIDERHFFHIDSLDEYDYSNFCLTPTSPKISNSVFRIDAAFPIHLDFALSELIKSGIDIKYCSMCKYYRFNDYYMRNICILYKSKGTKINPYLLCANNCPHFSLKEFQSEKSNDGCDYKIFIKGVK